MLRVKIYADDGSGDRELGYVSWDGAGLATDPPDSEELRAILAQPAVVPGGRGRPARLVRADDDPEAFLRALSGHYKSAYLRAGPAEEV